MQLKDIFGAFAGLAEARTWIDSICKDWAFKQIIPAHFAAPVPATPKDLRAAFTFAYEADGAPAASGASIPLLGRLFGGSGSRAKVEFDEGDMRALKTLDSLLKKEWRGQLAAFIRNKESIPDDTRTGNSM